MPRFPAVLLVTAALPLRALNGQWLVGADAAALRFAAVAQDTASADRPTTLTASSAVALRIERQFSRVRLGLGLLYARSGFATGDEDLAIEARDVFRLWELAPEIAVRLGTTGPGAALWIAAGPVLDVWMPEGVDTRSRAGAQAAFALTFPLFTRVAGAIRVQGSVTPSPFDAVDVEPVAEPRATRRLAVSVGFRYRV